MCGLRFGPPGKFFFKVVAEVEANNYVCNQSKDQVNNALHKVKKGIHKGYRLFIYTVELR